MTLTIRNARPDEWPTAGELLVETYSALEGFPTPEAQPGYYQNLRQVGELTRKPGTELLVAVNEAGTLLGCVVYYGDMAHYGAGDWQGLEDAAGFRFLGVGEAARGTGAGKALVQACLAKAKEQGKRRVILHTTSAMPVAWAMYERLGFVRAPEFDLEGMMPIYGFVLSEL